MEKNWTAKALLAFGMLVVVLLIPAIQSDIFPAVANICEQGQQTGHADCTSHSFFIYALWWISEFFDRYESTFIVLGTVAIAWFTYELRRSTDKLWAAGEKNFILQFRPRLVVRNISVNDKRPHKQRFDLFMAGKKVSGSFRITNVGGTAAQITNGICIVHWTSHGLPMIPPYDGLPGNDSIVRVKLLPGQSADGRFESDDMMTEMGKSVGTQVMERLEVFVMGWIEYTDDTGILRRMEFCRKYAREFANDDGRFYAVDDADYHHEG